MSLAERVRRCEDAVVIICQDPLSRSSVHGLNRQVSEALQVGEALSAGGTVVLIDLRTVTRVDNEALSELCVTLRRFDGASLRIVGADARVRGVLELCAISGLEFAPSIKPALARPRTGLAGWRRSRSRRARAREPNLRRSPSRLLS